MRLHYYALSFFDNGGEGPVYGNIYISLNAQAVSKANIDEARLSAGMEDQAVLLACCYLGLMSEAEFLAEW